MPITKFKELIPILDVRNVDTALHFYVERLGFDIGFRDEEHSDNYAGVRRDDVCLHMQWQHEEEFKKGTAGRVRGRDYVDVPHAVFGECKGKGVVDEPEQ